MAIQIPACALENAERPENRRRRERFSIVGKIALVPLSADGSPLANETLIVYGKDLSRTGICFSHDAPLAYRSFVLSFCCVEFGEFVVEAKVAWTRQSLIGLYDTGCWLVRKILVPPSFES